MSKSIKKSTRNSHDNALLELFGRNLRQIRERMELSQEQIAYEAGFSRSYYTEIETGKRNISLLNIIKICKFLKIDVNEIIQLKDFSSI